MKFDELSVEDQKLMNTDLGEDLEKVAAEKVATANEVYAYGCQQGETIAEEIDAMYKQAEEDEKEEKEEEEKEKAEEEGKDEEKKASDVAFEKTAEELGSFIERGVFDTLTKLGSENHDDPLHYYYPYIEEKVAKKGASKAIEGLKKMWGKTKDYHKGAVDDIRKGIKGGGKKGGKKGDMGGLDRAKSVGKGAAKLSPYALAVGGGVAAAKRKK